jgi:hypothetical protein
MFVSDWRGLVSREKERGAWSVERGVAEVGGTIRRTFGLWYLRIWGSNTKRTEVEITQRISIFEGI